MVFLLLMYILSTHRNRIVYLYIYHRRYDDKLHGFIYRYAVHDCVRAHLRYFVYNYCVFCVILCLKFITKRFLRAYKSLLTVAMCDDGRLIAGELCKLLVYSFEFSRCGVSGTIWLSRDGERSVEWSIFRTRPYSFEDRENK